MNWTMGASSPPQSMCDGSCSDSSAACRCAALVARSGVGLVIWNVVLSRAVYGLKSGCPVPSMKAPANDDAVSSSLEGGGRPSSRSTVLVIDEKERCWWEKPPLLYGL